MSSKAFTNLEFSPTLKKLNIKESIPGIEVGDNVRLSVKIMEGSKERIQISEGLIISKRDDGINSTFTVRRTVQGVGLERTYLLHSPLITNITVLRKSKVRRSKLYFLRTRFGKASRLKQSFKKR